MGRIANSNDEYIRLMNATAGLANQMTQSADAEKRRETLAREDRINQYSDVVTSGLANGQDAAMYAPGQRQALVDSFNDGLPEGQKIKQDQFKTSTDGLGLTSSEKVEGFNRAMELHLNEQKNVLNQQVYDFRKKFSNISSDELNKIDPNTLGNNALAARMALGQEFSARSNTEAGRVQMLENRDKAAQYHWNNWKVGILEADRAAKAGDNVKASQILANTINGDNNSAYKATPNADGTLTMYMTTHGVDEHDDKPVSVQDTLKRMRSISQTQYTKFFHAAAEDARKQNEESAANPIPYVNKSGQLVYVVTRTDPLTSDYNIDAYSNGKQIPGFQSFADLLKAGYTPFKSKNENDKASLGNQILREELTGRKLSNQRTAVEIQRLKEKPIESTEQQKYRYGMLADAVVGAAAQAGIQLEKDQNTGAIKSTKPMSPEQKETLNKILTSTKLFGYYQLNPDSIDVAWSPFDRDGYDLVVTSPLGIGVQSEQSGSGEGKSGGSGSAETNLAILKGQATPDGKPKERKSIAKGLWQENVPADSPLNKIPEYANSIVQPPDKSETNPRAKQIDEMSANAEKEHQMSVARNKLSYDVKNAKEALSKDPNNKTLKKKYDDLLKKFNSMK